MVGVRPVTPFNNPAGRIVEAAALSSSLESSNTEVSLAMPWRNTASMVGTLARRSSSLKCDITTSFFGGPIEVAPKPSRRVGIGAPSPTKSPETNGDDNFVGT